MVHVSPHPTPGPYTVRSWGVVALLLGTATLVCALFDSYLTLTSHAMIYVLAIVIASYRLDWVQSAVCAIAAVTALNFFFVPPPRQRDAGGIHPRACRSGSFCGRRGA